MKVLILSEYGEGLGLAKKIRDEGHSVSIFVKNRIGLSGEEIVNVVSSWRPIVPEVDLVISDSIKFLSYEEGIKEKGKVAFNFCPRAGDTQGWFNGRDWIKPRMESTNYVRMLTGDLGPVTTSMGSVHKTTDVAPKIEMLTEELKLNGFKGPVHGFAGNIFDILIEGLREPITDLIFETATGTKKEMNLTEDYLICVRVMSDRQNTMIEGLNEENLKHIHLYNVSKDLAGNYYSWGGTVLKVTARGRSIKEARRRVYRTLKNIHIDDIQYRTDIGEDLEY